MFAIASGLILVILGLVVASFVLWVLALVDVLRIPEPAWAAAGQSRVVWLLVVVFLHALGAVLYLVIARPQLRSATGWR